MRTINTKTLLLVLRFLAGLVIVRVTVAVVLNYRNYFPPNFESEFLQGREDYFWGNYQYAFYPHLVAGPVSLILGLILVSDQFRRRFPSWHRVLGRIQALVVLFGIAPSGLWMAFRAQAGPAAGLGLALLAVVTGLCVVLGWRAAVQQRFTAHRQWMRRCFVSLCSAVAIRMIGGFTTVTGINPPWLDVFAPWASWLIPLAALELSESVVRIVRRHWTPPSPTAARGPALE
jgi:hypothetical protein